MGARAGWKRPLELKRASRFGITGRVFLIRKSERSVEEIKIEFRRVVRRLGFVYVGLHDMKDFLMKKGHHIEGEYLVFEFSHPKSLRSAWQFFPATLSLSPARVAAYTQGGQTFLTIMSSRSISAAIIRANRFRGKVAATLKAVGNRHELKLRKLLDLLARRGRGA